MRRLFKAACALLAASFAFTACGCALFNTNEDAPPPASTPMPVIDVTPSPSPSPSAINPVAQFYSSYFLATEGDHAGLNAQLTAGESIGSMQAMMLYDEHMAWLSKAQVSIARLPMDGEHAAGTLIGPATGSGSLTKYSQLYAFGFEYDGGGSLSGTFDGNMLSFTCLDQGQALQCRVLLVRNGRFWYSCVEKGGTCTALLTGGLARFMSGPASPPAEHASPSPTPLKASQTNLVIIPTPIPVSGWYELTAGLALAAAYG